MEPRDSRSCSQPIGTSSSKFHFLGSRIDLGGCKWSGHFKCDNPTHQPRTRMRLNFFGGDLVLKHPWRVEEGNHTRPTTKPWFPCLSSCWGEGTWNIAGKRTNMWSLWDDDSTCVHINREDSLIDWQGPGGTTVSFMAILDDIGILWCQVGINLTLFCCCRSKTGVAFLIPYQLVS